jgi:trimeric autotransporter adhesin
MSYFPATNQTLNNLTVTQSGSFNSLGTTSNIEAATLGITGNATLQQVLTSGISMPGRSRLQIGSDTTNNISSSNPQAILIGPIDTATVSAKATNQFNFGRDAIVIGAGAYLATAASDTDDNNIIIGSLAAAYSNAGTTFNNISAGHVFRNTVIGAQFTFAQGSRNISLGNGAGTSGKTNIALGDYSKVGTGELSVGPNGLGVAPVPGIEFQNSIAIGNVANVQNNESVAIGHGATTVLDHQIMLGTSAEQVTVPGILTVAGATTLSGNLSATNSGSFNLLGITTTTTTNKLVVPSILMTQLSVTTAQGTGPVITISGTSFADSSAPLLTFGSNNTSLGGISLAAYGLGTTSSRLLLRDGLGSGSTLPGISFYGFSAGGFIGPSGGITITQPVWTNQNKLYLNSTADSNNYLFYDGGNTGEVILQGSTGLLLQDNTGPFNAHLYFGWAGGGGVTRPSLVATDTTLRVRNQINSNDAAIQASTGIFSTSILGGALSALSTTISGTFTALSTVTVPAITTSGTQVQIGISNTVVGSSAVAIGNLATTNGTGAIAIGFNTSSSAAQGIALGNNVTTVGTDTVAIGYNLTEGAGGSLNVLIGAGPSSASNINNSIAIGQSANTQGNGAIAIGFNAGKGSSGTGVGQFSVAVGEATRVDGGSSVALGFGANTGTFTTAAAIGTNSVALANNQFVLGIQNNNYILPGTNLTLSGQGNAATPAFSVGGTNAYGVYADTTNQGLGFSINGLTRGELLGPTGSWSNNGAANTANLVVGPVNTASGVIFQIGRQSIATFGDVTLSPANNGASFSTLYAGNIFAKSNGAVLATMVVDAGGAANSTIGFLRASSGNTVGIANINQLTSSNDGTSSFGNLALTNNSIGGGNQHNSYATLNCSYLTTTKSTNYNPSISLDSNVVFDNANALGTVNFTLAQINAFSGQKYSFHQISNQPISITPNVANTIALPGLTLVSGQAITSTTQSGSFVSLVSAANNTWEVESFGGYWGQTTQIRVPTASQTGSTYNVPTSETGYAYDNNGANGTVTFNLPFATVGLKYTFGNVSLSQSVVVAPSGLDVIAFSTKTGGASLTSPASVYGSIKLVCTSPGFWTIEGINGTWT